MSYLPQAAGSLIWMVIPCVGALVRTCRVRDRAERREIRRRWWAIGALGLGSLWMTFSFLAIPDAMAEAIGFTRTSFTFEIAFANLGLAFLGFRAASASACSSGVP
jgi:apolipoprotein N-acyltransferase